MNETKDCPIASFVHILENVGMLDGVASSHDKNHIAIYSSCMFLESGTYYYKTYTNFQLNATSFRDHDLDSKEIIVFAYFNNLNIHYYK